MIRQIARQSRTIAFTCTCLLLVNSCAVDPKTGQPSFKQTFASNDPCAHNSRNIGITLGAAAGALLGYATKKDTRGALIGGAAGALVGGFVGADMDRRRCALSKVAKQYGLNMQVQEVRPDGQVVAATNHDENNGQRAGLAVNVSDDKGQFISGSDQLTPRAQAYFAQIATEYDPGAQAAQIKDPAAAAKFRAAAKKRKLLLVGHTDDTGSSVYNATLSERRARSVAHFMARHSVPAASIYYQGAGETLPIADNHTAAGRARNRRVEIVDVSDAANFKKYLNARTPNYAYYRVATPQPLAAAARRPTSKPVVIGSGSTTARQTLPATTTNPSNAPTGNTTLVPSGAAGRAVSSSVATTQANIIGIDFDGALLTAENARIGVGTVLGEPAGFSFTSKAYAEDAPVLARCDHDRPRITGEVKALATGKAYATRDYLPGLFETTWYERINGHELVLNKVGVLREGAAPANRPELKVYTNYDPRKNRNPSPALSMRPKVNVYRGSNGLLYRVFADGREGVECLDIVLPRDGGFRASDGRLLYEHRGKLYVAKIKPQMLR